MLSQLVYVRTRSSSCTVEEIEKILGSCKKIILPLFPSWHMATRKNSNQEIQYRTDISQEDKVIFEGLMKGEKSNDLTAVNLLKKFFQS